MNMKFVYSLIFILLLSISVSAQNIDIKISQKLESIEKLYQQIADLSEALEELKLNRIIRDLKAIALPSDNYVEHAAMILSYNENQEQANWVAHIILPDVIDGVVFRTNDFREDPLIKSGTAVQEDYFTTDTLDDGKVNYDGYGYDRGHLAPSADFRWSAKALSESYYYSNMSPQLPELNREIWADLENTLRGYIYKNKDAELYVITGPILSDDLPVQERSINKLTIPERYYKVILDLKNKEGIGFIIPNSTTYQSLEIYARSIDFVEEETGYDFFSLLDPTTQKTIEKNINLENWLPEIKSGDVLPLIDLPKNAINTITVDSYTKSNASQKVCGTVVSNRYSKKGHLWMNIDKQFPNQVFSVFIRKYDLINFSYDPKKTLLNQKVCFTGIVESFSETPTMNISKENKLEVLK